jgi:hypothetical protein
VDIVAKKNFVSLNDLAALALSPVQPVLTDDITRHQKKNITYFYS